MNSKSDEELILAFVEFSSKRKRQLIAGSIKAANKTYVDMLKAMGREIRSRPDRGTSILKQLLRSTQPDIRMEAGFLLLPVDEDTAVDALTTLGNEKFPGVSNTARITMSEWRAGNLDVNWFMKD